MTHVALGRARDEFDEFVARNTESLLRSGFLMTADAQEAEDIVQECLLRVARRWPQVRRMDYPGAYARRILVRLALDGAKRRSRRLVELAPAGCGDSAERASTADGLEARRSDTKMTLVGALRRVPQRQRTAIVLRFYEDLSEAQVASLMQCSIGTVKSATSRGLARLRSQLEEGETGEREEVTNGD